MSLSDEVQLPLLCREFYIYYQLKSISELFCGIITTGNLRGDKDMEDQSQLDKKYFLDEEVYNCPFCNRNNVVYGVVDDFRFNWSKEKTCYGYLVKCSSCGHISMHLSFTDILDKSKNFKFEDRLLWRFMS